MAIHKSLENKKFGRIILLHRVENIGKRPAYLGLCECGNKKVFEISKVKRGVTKSCGCIKRKLYGESSARSVFNTYKKHAIKRNYIFEITFEEFKKISQLNCYYCGKSPSNLKHNKYTTGNYIYNGIDRVNNNNGYIRENIVSCCYYCNGAKSNKTKEEFINWVISVYKHSVKEEVNQLF